MRSIRCLALVWIVSAVVACSGSDGGAKDTYGVPDWAEDLSSDNLTADTLDLSRPSDSADGAMDQVGPADLGDQVPSDANGGDLYDAADPGDTAEDGVEPQDVETDQDQPPLKEFCYRSDACPAGQECNVSSGLCERRAKVLSSVASMYSFEPRVAAAGDRLVIDGEGFYTGLFPTAVSVVAGSVGLSLDGVDENRVVAIVSANAGGTLKLTAKNGMALSSYPLTPGPSGIVACGDDDPPPFPGQASHPADGGSYAAGFADFKVQGDGRVFYPAECGGVRRTPAAGSFPVVMLCHGDGASPLNYEYLGKHLATWGFVSIMPETSEPSQIANLANNPAQAFDGAIPAPTLDTSHGVVMVGHSKGGDRIEQAWSELNNVAGIIYLGQVNSGEVFSVPIVIFGASNDFQSDPGSYAENLFDDWGQQAWKVVVQGGNHSAFSDHKVWQGAWSDGAMVVERSRQHLIVQQYSLPFIQRFLYQTEAFPEYLDSPQPEADFTVEWK